MVFVSFNCNINITCKVNNDHIIISFHYSMKASNQPALSSPPFLPIIPKKSNTIKYNNKEYKKVKQGSVFILQMKHLESNLQYEDSNMVCHPCRLCKRMEEMYKPADNYSTLLVHDKIVDFISSLSNDAWTITCSK